MELDNEIIYIATQERADNYPYFLETIPGNVQIVSILDFCKIKDNYNIEMAGKPTVGTILARNPYDKRNYIEFDKFAQTNFIEYKWRTLQLIAMHLGAKLFEIECKSSVTEKRDWSVDMNLISTQDTTNAGGTIIKTSDKSEVFNKTVRIVGDPNNRLTKKSYEIAENIAKQTGLYNDVQIHQLLESRTPGNNKDDSFDKNMDYESTSNSTFQSAIKMSLLPKFFLDFNVSYKRNEIITITEKYHIHINFSCVKQQEKKELPQRPA